MERAQVSKKDFNKLTKDELLSCFALVTHDGSDQYVSGWKEILDNCVQEAVATKKLKQDAAKKLIETQTNLQLLDKYYELNSDLNGNNHEIILAKIVKEVPKLFIAQIG